MFVLKIVTTVLIALMLICLVFVAVKSRKEEKPDTAIIAGVLSAIQILSLFCMWY